MTAPRRSTSMSGMRYITANDLAGDDPGDQKSFRGALRQANLVWHQKNARWKVVSG